MSGSASMSLECDMESSQEELLESSETARLGAKRRRTVTLIAGLLTMFAAVSLWQNPTVITQVTGGLFIGLDEEVAAASEEGCGDLPFVKLTNVVSSNLGKQGPNQDAEEGIIYEATAYHAGVEVSNLQIHVHSVEDFDVAKDDEEHYDKNYVAAFTHGEYVNGIHGRFAAINVKQGESVKLRVHAYDAEEKKDIALPHAAISFFDLDTGADDTHSVEHVKIEGFKSYYVSNATEVNVTEEGDFTVFTATKEGTGDDNPTDPTMLTVLQKNRAVTVEFEDVESFDFEVGASAGATGRVFSFVFRPSMLCAKTKLADGTLLPAKGASAPLVPVQGAAHKGLPSVVMVFGVVSAVVQSFM